MEQYYINEGVLYQIENEEMTNEKEFDTHEEIVEYCKNKLAKLYHSVLIRDYDLDGDVTFKDGKIVYTSPLMGIDDGVLEKRWGFETDEYEVECTNCGDGGCIHCEPHRFI